MEKLLKWSIESAAHDASSGRAPPKPDSKALHELFGGADDSQLMMQAVTITVNPESTVEEKEQALDNLEMLVENLDNANNMENIGLWHPLIVALKNPDTNKSIKKMICWVFGTAVQNNVKSQKDLASKEDAVPTLLDLAGDLDSEVAAKALYALSSLLGHCQEAYVEFKKHSGWKVLTSVLESSNESYKLKLRALSVIHSLSDIEPKEEKLAKFKEIDIIGDIIAILKAPEHEKAHEKAINCVSVLTEHGYKLTAGEKKVLVQARKELIAQQKIKENDMPIV